MHTAENTAVSRIKLEGNNIPAHKNKHDGGEMTSERKTKAIASSLQITAGVFFFPCMFYQVCL